MRFVRNLAVILCALTGAGLLSSLVAPRLIAQIRAALVKNVDEPGRQPYQAYIEFSQASCSFNCSNFVSFGSIRLFDGPAVPAGKRLVIRNVSGRLPNATTAGVQVALQTSQILSAQNVKWAYFGPYELIGSALASFSANTFVTCEPGEQPHFNLLLPSANNFVSFVSVSGYLIDATN